MTPEALRVRMEHELGPFTIRLARQREMEALQRLAYLVRRGHIARLLGGAS
jgi:hypothetical protein